ncbi:hypothetical protein [Bacteroides acidifaciens]|uniref:hypothetical protein n=1 Tax=Bacteroides acidifaciens TaxID=85831 RepID=UPI003F6926AF
MARLISMCVLPDKSGNYPGMRFRHAVIVGEKFNQVLQQTVIITEPTARYVAYGSCGGKNVYLPAVPSQKFLDGMDGNVPGHKGVTPGTVSNFGRMKWLEESSSFYSKMARFA